MGEEARTTEQPAGLVRDIRVADLGDLLGAWDPDTGVIWLHHDLTQAELRSTLAHEQIHAERGDQACCTAWHEARQEREVAQLAARRLIPLERLAEALLWTLDEHELADELWVDVQTVRDRLAGLSPAEQEELDRLVWEAERYTA